MNCKQAVVFLILFFLGGIAFSQQQKQFKPLESGNILLQFDVQNSENQKKGHLIIHGNTLKIKELIEQHNGLIKYTVKNAVSALVELNSVPQILRNPFVDFIEYTAGQGVVLTNETVTNVKANLVKQGLSPLPRGYTGKGVLMGIIDTGIDFEHPDFKDENGNTRIVAIWDQTKPLNSSLTPSKFGYGQAWDSTEINNGNCTHVDPMQYFGHGTNVSGVAVGNGNSVPDSIADYSGIAPDASIAVVATDFGASNWTSTVADAAMYLFELGDSLGMPIVLNASLGQLLGSHDGLDTPAQLIDSMINAKPGRVMVCAAGNSGQVPPFHLQMNVQNDSTFSLFEINPSSALGGSAVFFEGWLDTNSAKNMQFALDVTDTSSFGFPGRSDFFSLPNRFNTLELDTIFSPFGSFIAEFYTYTEQQNSRVLFQVYFPSPDLNYYYGLHAKGVGKIDIWSSSNFGWSNILFQDLPNASSQPRFLNYSFPDTLQSIVNSWNCSPNVISVGNYINRSAYLDIDSVLQTFPVTKGDLAASSSKGPTRLGLLKPDLTAPGDITLASGKLQDLSAIKNVAALRSFIGLGGWHRRVGGTSMASPAVAGTVALLFEKCQNLTNQEVLAELYGHAFQDSLTGTNLPNFAWGRGKVDAFATLNATNYAVDVSATTDSLVCPQNPAIFQTIPNNFISYTWSNGDSSSKGNFDLPGKYQVEVRDFRGCEAISDSFSVKASQLPSINVFLGNDTAACFSDSLQLSISPKGNTFDWSVQETDSNISVSAVPLVWATIKNSDGCTFSDTIQIQFIKGIQSVLPESLSYCQQDSVLLSPTLPVGSYFWLDGTFSSTRWFNSPGSYVLKATDSLGCESFDTVVVSESPLPVFSLGTDTGLCIGQRHELKLNGPTQMTSYVWSDGSQSQILTICDSTVANCDFYLQQKDTISLSVLDSNNCHFSDTIFLSISSLPDVRLINDTALCANASFSIPLTNLGIGVDHYKWSTFEQSESILVDSFGIYKLQGFNRWGCYASDSMQIDSLSVPYFSLGADTMIVNGKDISIFGPNGMESYLWSNNDTTQLLAFFLGEKVDSTIWLKVQNKEGCFYADTVNLQFLVKTPSFSSNSLNIFPNPAQHYIYLSNHIKQPKNYSIYDASGKLVKVGIVSTQISLLGLAEGIYFVQFFDELNQPILASPYKLIKGFDN